jgi:hypothetical protein
MEVDLDEEYGDFAPGSAIPSAALVASRWTPLPSRPADQIQKTGDFLA